MEYVRSCGEDRSFVESDQVRRDDGDIFLFIEEFESVTLNSKAVRLLRLKDDGILEVRADRFYKGQCKRGGCNKKFKFEKVVLMM